MVNSNRALFVVQISFSPPGFRKTEYEPLAQRCWEAILPWGRSSAARCRLWLTLSADSCYGEFWGNCGSQQSRTPSTFLLLCTTVLPVLHIWLWNQWMILFRELLQLKNTHIKKTPRQMMESQLRMGTGKGVMGQEYPECLLSPSPFCHGATVTDSTVQSTGFRPFE